MQTPDCASLMFGPWVLNEIWITDLSSALIGMLMSSSKLFLFSKEVHLNSGVRLLLELYCVLSSSMLPSLLFGRNKQWHSLVPVYLWTFTLLFSDVVVVSDFNKHFGGSTDLAKKKARIGGFAYPYSPPSCTYKFIVLVL